MERKCPCDLLVYITGNCFFVFFPNRHCMNWTNLDLNEFDFSGLLLHYNYLYYVEFELDFMLEVL